MQGTDREELLKPYNFLDSLPEEEYDAITEMAAKICNTPIALLSVVSNNRQYFKSRYGLDRTEAPLENSFCQLAIQTPEQPLIVPDASKDKQFKNVETIIGDPQVVFYAGITVRGINGVPIGTLSVMDHKPHIIEDRELDFLNKLARQVEKLFELSRSKITLADKTSKLENILEATEAGTWEWDLNADTVTLSRRWFSMIGYLEEDFKTISSKAALNFTHPEERNSIGEIIQKCLDEELDLIDIDIRIKHKIGKYIWVNSRGKVIRRSPEGRPEKMFGTHVKITEKKISQDLVRFNEQRFKSLVQEGGDLIAILDNEANYVYVSPTSERILGTSPEEYLDRNAFDFIHPDDAERIMNEFKQLATKKRIELEPFRFSNRHGEWRWMKTTVTNLLDDPAVKGIVANSQDVTEQKQDEQHRRLLESVVVHAKDAIMITEAEPFDHPGPRILYVNEAFTKMTGYTEEEVIGKTPRILQGPDSDYDALYKMGKALRRWEVGEATTINYRKNGEKFWINFTTIPVADENGWYTHWISIERDVTMQVNREREKKLISDIGKIFNREKDLHSCLIGVLDHIIEFDTFKIAEVWLPDNDSSRLIFSAHSSKGEEGRNFYKKTKDITSFEMGKGLPGVVAASHEDAFWDLEKDTGGFIRREAAMEVGIKTVMGIPLIHQDELKGVLLLGSPLRTEELTHLKSLLQELRYFFGAEIKRKKLETELETIFKSAPDIIAISNYDGYFVKINPAAAKILGYSQKELTSKPYTEFIHQNDVAKTIIETKELSTGRVSFNFENRYLSADGHVVWLNWTARPLPEQGLVYSVAKDVTLIKESEQAQRKLLEEKNSILESLKDGFFSLDIDWTVRYWNRFAENILGKKREEIIGKNLWEEYPDAVHLDFYKYYRKAMYTMETQQFVEYYPATENWFDVSAYPTEDGLSVFFRDITKQMGYIKSIEEQNERFREIAFKQSHEVRAPLTRILGLVDLLLEEDNRGEKERWKMLGYIKDAATELDQVIHDVVQKTDTSELTKDNE